MSLRRTPHSTPLSNQPESIVGTPGDDLIDPGAGNDTVRGGDGNDTIDGNYGDDQLFGEGGNDTLVDTLGSDLLDGGDGNDTLTGSVGDTLVGGAGDDRIDTGQSESARLVTTGTGADLVIIQGAYAARWGNSPSSDPVRITDFDFAAGDRLDTGHYSTWGSVIWRGAAADPAFIAADGQSVALAGTQVGSGFTSTISLWTCYDAATDTTILYADRPTEVGSEPNGLVDHLDLRIEFAGHVDLSWTWFMDHFTRAGTDFADTSADLELGAGSDAAWGLGGNDSLDGGGGDDRIVGDGGNDTLAGSLGNDTLNGGAGDDSMHGGDGDDELFAGHQGSQGGLDTAASNNWLYGDAGNDSLQGHLGNDYLSGGTGNDSLYGYEGNDMLVGGDGDDTLLGYQGDDLMQGGAGNDMIYVGDYNEDNGYDTIDGGDGDDTFSLSGGGGAVITGGAGADRFDIGQSTIDDTFRITDFDRAEGDLLNYSLGDTVWRGAAASAFTGELGQSVALTGGIVDARFSDLWKFIDPTTGREVLFCDINRNGVVDATDLRIEFDAGTVVDPTLFGDNAMRCQVGTEGDDTDTAEALGAASDFVYALGGDDTLDGLGGQDIMHGEAGNDRLLGGADNDYLFGAIGDDVLDGGAGDDELYGGFGNDTLSGGDGRDFIDVNGVAEYHLQTPVAPEESTAHNEAHGGEGNDTIRGSGGNDSLFGDAGLDSLTGGAGNDRLDGGDGNDTLLGDDGNDVLVGGVGIDRLTGGNGDDFLNGGLGFDILTGGAGNDTMHGGGDNDVYYVDATGDLVVEAAGQGIDQVISTLATYTLGANVENMRLMVGADGVGNALANVMIAGTGDNAMNGGAGADTVTYLIAESAVTVWLALTGAQATGGSGSDTLVNFENVTGSQFGDTLTGNSTANLIDGFWGNDTLVGGAGNDSLLGGTENDRLDGGAGDDRLDGGEGIDTATYAASLSGVTVNLAYATAQATGGAGSDTLMYIENLIGSAYADELRGNAGANRIEGGNGSDWILGGGGADVLGGGIGADVFVFAFATESTLGARDTVLDFNRFQGDKLDVSRIDANATLAGNQAFSFIGSAAFGADATGQLRYANGIVYGSTDADSDAEFAIALTGTPALLAADFLL